jgi:pimeloyl-ACP methyl ester carboxylesterase
LVSREPAEPSAAIARNQSMSPTRTKTSLIEHRKELAGIETRGLAVPGEGPPILLLHGYADSADTWRPLLERFRGVGRAAAAFDLRGFGTAEQLDPLQLLMPQWDEMVEAAIAELAEEYGGDVFVVGNSLGGALSLRAAGRSGLQVGGIVPIAPAGLHMASWFSAIEREWLVRLLRVSPFPVPDAVVKPIVGRVYRTLAFGDPGSADPGIVATFTGHISSFAKSMGVLETGRRLLPELNDPFELQSIDCPLLLIWGERDRMVFTTGAERVLRTVDYSDIEVIPDCGHCPQVEVPDLLADLLLGFPGNLEYAP